MEWESRIPPADAANLVIDRPGQANVFLAAGLLTPGGFVGADGTLRIERLREELTHRVGTLPQLRRVPARRGRRTWWALVAPDLAEHVRLAPSISGTSALGAWCGALMSQPLPRSRPLWELLVAQYRAESGEAVAVFVLRLHHAIADGIAAVELAHRILDAPATAPRVPNVAAAARRRPAGGVGRAAKALRRLLATFLSGRVPPTVLLGPRSDAHGVAFASADLDALAASARRSGATVNDALLAAVIVGLRAALETADQAIPDELPVSVPVALPRRPGTGNQVGLMVVRLPLSAASSVERLSRIAAQTVQARPRAREEGTLELMRGPLGARMMNRVAAHQRLVCGFVTNVPGPVAPLRLAGSAVESIWPAALIAGNVRVGVAAVSYAGRVFCGIHFDAGHVDGNRIAAAMGREFDLLTGRERER